MVFALKRYKTDEEKHAEAEEIFAKKAKKANNIYSDPNQEDQSVRIMDDFPVCIALYCEFRLKWPLFQ